MTTVLAIVQNMVLAGAFEYTFAIAKKLFNKRIQSKESTTPRLTDPDVYDHETHEPASSRNVLQSKVINIKVPDTVEKPKHFSLDKNPSIPDVESRCTIYDMQYKMIGPISPPKNSHMQMARDSYFS